MSEAELHTLTGAYALNALDPRERAAFARHLAECESCAREVREFAATAAVLGTAVAEPPPAALRARVLDRIAAVRQEPPGARPPRERAGGRWRRAPTLVPAACLAAAAALGGVAVWQYQLAEDARREARQQEQRAEAVAALLAAPDARLTTGELPGGATGTVVVSRSQDRAAVITSGMPPAPSGHAYQLWYDDPAGGMRPAGLMPGAPDGTAVLLSGPLGDATGMGITVEPAGGSPQPTTEPLVVMEFPG